MNQTSSNTIAIYTPDKEADKNLHQKKHSDFNPVTHNNITVYIRKTTAIWLSQDCEHVSSDRLFRARAKQPNFS